MGGLKRRYDTPENREFWDFIDRTALEVMSWPKWKRGGESTPEPVKRKTMTLNLPDLPGKTIDRVEVDNGQFSQEVYEARQLPAKSEKFSSRTVRFVFTDGTTFEVKCGV